jgi:hypothetical protein
MITKSFIRRDEDAGGPGSPRFVQADHHSFCWSATQRPPRTGIDQPQPVVQLAVEVRGDVNTRPGRNERSR